MPFSFDKDLNNEINKTFKNFNAKVTYNKTKTRGRGMLPEKVSVKSFKEKYSDKPRAEIERQLALYKSFGKRNSLDKTNTRLSEWELKFFEANRSKTRTFYDQEINDLERIIGDKPEYHLRIHNRLQTLIAQRAELDKDFTQLTEDEIKGIRGYISYAERSELSKQRGFRLYLAQLERTMNNLGYSKEEINTLFAKFNELSENEFLEMVRNEDLIESVYDLIDSPKKRGTYELMTDEKRARGIITEIQSRADSLVNKYKTKK